MNKTLSAQDGHVFEWYNDFYESDYYKQSSETNPTVLASGPFRAVRVLD